MYPVYEPRPAAARTDRGTASDLTVLNAQIAAINRGRRTPR